LGLEDRHAVVHATPPGRATQTTDAVPRGPVREARLWTRPHASPRMLTHCAGGRPDLTQVLSSNERSCFYCPVTKGAQTREAVLAEAMDQASLRGLNGLTIGTLADQIGRASCRERVSQPGRAVA